MAEYAARPRLCAGEPLFSPCAALTSAGVGGRDREYALAFVDGLCSRLANQVQLISDSHTPYLEAVEQAFGDDIDLPC
jgi:hypothetical protein